MRKSTIAISFIGLAIFSITSGFDILNDTGKAGRTGSPGETTCTGCHTGSAINDGIGSVSISSPDLVGWEYEAGLTYTINVTVSRTGSPLFGFGCECLTTANQNAGTLVVTNSQTHILNATVMSVVRKNMVHSSNGGASPDTHTFSFEWTAPSSNVGDVTFYVTGNATNGNNANSGDHIYSTTQVVTPLAGTSINTTEINMEAFSVFPNPAHNNFSVAFSAPQGMEIDLQLISATGKEVAMLHHQNSDGTPQKISFPIPPDLPKGIYLIRLVCGDNSVSRRIIIQ